MALNGSATFSAIPGGYHIHKGVFGAGGLSKGKSHREIDPILANTPEVFVRQFISDDRHMGSISFYIIYDSIEYVNEVIEGMVRDA